MYEIVVAINGKEFVADTRPTLIAASEAVSWYLSKKVQAHYRPLNNPAGGNSGTGQGGSNPNHPHAA